MDSIYLLLFVITASVTGYALRFLNISGAVAACIVGFLIGLGFRYEGLLMLGLFFLTSSLWSKYKRHYKKKTEETHSKGSRRDWHQVLANGGVASIASLLFFLTGDSLWVLIFTVSLACSNSDTWASEIGTLSKKEPYSVKTFKRTARGVSGSVSVLGTVAALLGSLTIAISAIFLFDFKLDVAILIAMLGFAGNIMDSYLGAYLQITFKCKQCGIISETKYHCGIATAKVKGLSWLNNDAVNLLSNIIISLLSIFVFKIY